MVAPVLALSNCLTNECSKSVKDRAIEASYGNGYKQVAPDGLNSTVEIWNIVYPPFSGTNLTTLRTFLNTVGVSTWFTWTPFGESSSKKWRVVKDSKREALLNTELVQITFVIEQCFDLGE